MDARACFCRDVHAIIPRLFGQTHGNAREDIYQEEEKQMKRKTKVVCGGKTKYREPLLMKPSLYYLVSFRVGTPCHPTVLQCPPADKIYIN